MGSMYKSNKKIVNEVININGDNGRNGIAQDNYFKEPVYYSNMTIVDEEKRLAFEKEALPHYRTVYNFCYKMMGNKLDADDMIQETYLRAFLFFDSYERGTNCRAWLFKIMKNLIINKYRKEKKDAVKVDIDDVINFIPKIKSIHLDTADVQEMQFSRLLDDEITLALKSIHDDYRMVVILCDLEGLSYEEIAEFLNCPIGTVRSRIHRGRRLLQQKLFLYARQRGYNAGSSVN
jgi:RNA polymerase sigma-70 factor (ECF subfamily)